MSKPTHIKQPDNFGCGIACVAMIIGKEYDCIRSLIPNDALATRDGCQPELLWYILGFFGYSCQITVWANHKEQWPVLESEYNIVNVSCPFSNYVLEYDGTVYDPAENTLSSLDHYSSPSRIIGVSKP